MRPAVAKLKGARVMRPAPPVSRRRHPCRGAKRCPDRARGYGSSVSSLRRPGHAPVSLETAASVRAAAVTLGLAACGARRGHAFCGPGRVSSLPSSGGSARHRPNGSWLAPPRLPVRARAHRAGSAIRNSGPALLVEAGPTSPERLPALETIHHPIPAPRRDRRGPPGACWHPRDASPMLLPRSCGRRG